MTNVETVAGRVISHGHEVVHDGTRLALPDQVTAGADVSSSPSLRDARAVLAIHRPDTTGICLGCLAFARLAGSRCPIASQAAHTMRLFERSTTAG